MSFQLNIANLFIIKMKSILNKIKMKNLVSSLLHIFISLLILTGSIHLYEHNHAEEDGYTICTPACDTETHHSINDHCETCLKNRYQHKIFYHPSFYNYKNDKPISKNNDIFIFNKYIIYSFSYSRPPPTQIT